jgi:hypothetical protein
MEIPITRFFTMSEHLSSLDTTEPATTFPIDLSRLLLVPIDGKPKHNIPFERISRENFSSSSEQNGDRISFCHAATMDFNGISHILRQIQDGENQQEARSQLVILLEARGLVRAQVSSIVEYHSDLLNHRRTLENCIVDSFLDELSEDMSKGWTCPEDAQDRIKYVSLISYSVV